MTISKRYFWIGIISSLLISILHLLNAFYEYSGVIDETYNIARNLIYTIAFSYFFTSILFLLNSVLIDYYKQESLRNNLAWIIRLYIVISVLAILTILGFSKFIFILSVILLIINLIFFILFLRGVMSLDETDVPTIGQLKNFILSLMIVILLRFILGFIIEFGMKHELKYLNQIFMSVPFIFMSLFFYKTMKTIYK